MLESVLVVVVMAQLSRGTFKFQAFASSESCISERIKNQETKVLTFMEPVDLSFGVHVSVEPVTTPAAVFRLESAIALTELSP